MHDLWIFIGGGFAGFIACLAHLRHMAQQLVQPFAGNILGFLIGLD